MMLSSRAQLPDEAELTWDAGDAHRSRCWITCRDIVTKNTAAMYLMGGFAVLGGVYATAVAVDKPSKVPSRRRRFRTTDSRELERRRRERACKL